MKKLSESAVFKCIRIDCNNHVCIENGRCRSCANRERKGKYTRRGVKWGKHSEETKRMMNKNKLEYLKMHPEWNRMQSLRIKEISKGEKNSNWKGGRNIRKDGYIMIYSPQHPKAIQNKYLEHIIVVEKFIGRYLKDNEVIHHIDSNPSNNNINNLMIFPSQAEHMKWHAKMNQHGWTNIMRRQVAHRWEKVLT